MEKNIDFSTNSIKFDEIRDPTETTVVKSIVQNQ